MTKDKKDRSKQLEDFADTAGTLLYGLSTVPDDWINQLKVYRKIELTDGDTAMMWLTILSLYIELLIRRVEDLITFEEAKYLEHKCKEKILKAVKLVNFYGQDDADEKTKAFSNIVDEIMALSRSREKGTGEGIIQMYIYSFIKSFGERVPEDILISYVNSKIELFEEQNLRNKFANRIE